MATLALTLLSAAVSAVGTIAQGNAIAAEKDFEAKQRRIKAKEERASSQREVMQKDREVKQLMSRQRSIAGASGMGVTDPTVEDLSGDLFQEGEYHKGMLKYQGEERARGQRAAADAAEFEGQNAKRLAKFKAFGTILKGVGSLADKYGLGEPSGGGSYRYQ